MQRGVDDNISAHPSDEELAEYIDNGFDDARRAEIERHLVECDECSDVLALVVKYGEEVKIVEKKNDVKSDGRNEWNPVNRHDYKKSQVANQDYAQAQYANNWYHNKKIRAIVLSGLVASFAIFYIANIKNSNQFTLGTFSSSQQIRDNTLSATSKSTKNEIINGDEVIKEIEKSLDLTSIKSFVKAEEAEKKGDFRLALDLYYDDAFEEVNTTLSGEEQLKWKIIIYYRISQINFQEGIDDKESYKNITKEWIQEYILNK